MGFLFHSVDAQAEAVLWNFVQERARELGLFLRSCDGLDQLAFQETFELALTTRVRELRSGQLLYGREDQEVSTSIFALFHGSVLLEPAQGSSKQPISHVKPGELFGGLATIAGCRPFERAVAGEDCTILEFVGDNIEWLVSAKPGLGAALLRATTLHWIHRYVEALDRTLVVEIQDASPPSAGARLDERE